MGAFAPVFLLFLSFGCMHCFELFVKCCERGLILNEFMSCESTPNVTNANYALDSSKMMIDVNTTCSIRSEEKVSNSSSGIQTIFNSTCADIGPNGTLLFQNCSFIHRHNQEIGKCQNLFTHLKFWGVSIVVVASFIYIIPYSIVVILYCVMPDLRRKSFDKGVMVFCSTQVIIALILCTLGYFILCNVKMADIVYSLVGLSLMFFTITSVFWMLIMCFDVTLTITRFRWAPSSSTDDENRKFRNYITWVYVGALIPTAFVGILELTPLLPEDSIFKPNFRNFGDRNLAVILYVMTIPIIVLVSNSLLFVYTSWKMYKIQKSTSVAKENQKNNAKEKYLMYLKLYFLMDAPWVTSALGAIYPDLWILKIVRVVHPILLLLTILPRKMVVRTVKCGRQPNLAKKANIQSEPKIPKQENLAKTENSSEDV